MRSRRRVMGKSSTTPPENMLAVAMHQTLTLDPQAIIKDVGNWSVHKEFVLNSTAYAVDFSPNSNYKYLAIGTNSSPYLTIKDYNSNWANIEVGDVRASRVNGIAFSDDFLAIAHNNGVMVKQLAYLTNAPNSNDFTSGSYDVAWSPDGNYLAIAHFGGNRITIKLRNSSWANWSIGTLPGTAYGVAFSPNGLYLAIAHQAGNCITVKENYTTNVTVGNLPGTGRCVAFSPDGQYLAIGHDNAPYLTIKEVGGSWGNLTINNTQAYSVNSVAFSPDGQYLAVASGASNAGYNVKVKDVLNNWEDIDIGVTHSESYNAFGVAWSPIV